MNLHAMIGKVYKRVYRNKYNINGDKIKKNGVNLEWWSKKTNLGDQLALVIYKWMLEEKGIVAEQSKKIIHLMSLGSLIGMKNFDAVIWGSGIHCFGTVNSVIKNRKIVKYDIRVVRGPITGEILRCAGYSCKSIYGDPGVLMPLIYNPGEIKKKYEFSVIKHLSNDQNEEKNGFHYISIKTSDYESFIDEILASQCVISSSLHGIILAEAYGVPAIFLNENMDNELLKYYDWYFSTNRMSVVSVNSIEEAREVSPMPLPDLTKMQKELIENFPYDLFD